MSENKFVFKLERDTKGNEIFLDDMTIETTQIFLKIVDSIVKLANEYKSNDNSNDIKVNIFKSSAAVSLDFYDDDVLTEFELDLQNVSENNLENEYKVRKFRNLQDNILKENFRMVAYIEREGQTTPKLEIFKGKRFKLPRNRNIVRLPINKFEKVYLNKIGGGEDKTTLDLIYNKGEDNQTTEVIKVRNLDLAIGMKEYLYNNLFLLVNLDSNNKQVITDMYSSNSEMNLYKQWFEEIQELEGVARYRAFTERIRTELSIHNNFNEKIDKLFKHSILFLNSKVEPGMIRTILMTLKPFTNNSIIKDLSDDFIKVYHKSSKRKID